MEHDPLKNTNSEALGNAEKTEETDAEKIKRLFVEMPTERVELLANHLMRPDGFAKTLITGAICSSTELQTKIARNFAKPHRGYYMGIPHGFSGANDYISFSVGRTQQLYKRGNLKKPREKAIEKGLGFTLPAGRLMQRETVTPSWGNFGLGELASEAKDMPDADPKLIEYSRLSPKELYDREYNPPKEDFLWMVDTARKAGKLSGQDQSEVNMHKDGENFPRLSLDETIILIPEEQRETIRRYLAKKIKEAKEDAPKIKKEFSVDVSEIDADTVLSRKNIYWYPQENIEIAIEYLTTHPERIHEFFPQEKYGD